MKKKIGIVSYISTGAYDANTIDEDQILSGILKDLGFENEILPWSDPKIQWSDYDELLVKSVWDYFDYYPEFLEWLDRIDSLKIPVLNDLKTIRWNSNKRYLIEMAEKGFPVISGLVLEKGTKPDFSQIQKQMKSGLAVIKPLVSGGAKNTFKVSVENWPEYASKLEELLKEEAFLVQPFVKEVAEVGEYSLIFFNGNFSHAVLKTPKKEDFRVQHYFGGTIQVIQPSAKMLQIAQSFVDQFAPESLYARVDGVEINGEFYLMELELIEPYLFLGLTDQAIPNYKAAIEQRLS
ncbi:glutathione synthetase [Algoriphagus kandeliae]|uniref:Glutathione synthetase n=1 Tax=Algoriphagus kandeliae TaxID=2562278 RepID=A0A4Y9R119_9BACT|nr:glutathione synthetase [Algoriphagus kandeliae]TFV97888.1 glutathione synthetase [Algoriphagus kandeliae]